MGFSPRDLAGISLRSRFSIATPKLYSAVVYLARPRPSAAPSRRLFRIDLALQIFRYVGPGLIQRFILWVSWPTWRN